MRYLAFAAVALIACVWAGIASSAALSAPNETFISGGGISGAIRFAPIDADAFVRRVNAPPRLAEAPQPRGPSYTIRTPYWAQIMPGTPGVRPAAGEEATYYPVGGYVRAVRPDTDTWLVLDPRQRAIIDRYVRLGERDLITGEPGILEVLRADLSAGGSVAVDVNGRPLSVAQAAAFWDALARSPRPSFAASPSEPAPTGTTVTLTLPEGRTVTFQYEGKANTLTDHLGTEMYAVSAQLAQAISAVTGPATAVPQDAGAGSPLWWVVAVGAGTALVAAAVVLRRHLSYAAA